MYQTLGVLCVIFGIAYCAERGPPCLTPNGENATCIPVDSCRPIKQAIAFFDQAAIEFARASQCGHEEGPLVCCGSVGWVTRRPSDTPSTPIPPVPVHIPSTANPIDHLLLPDSSLCGLQVPENDITWGEAEETEFPWTAALMYTRGSDIPKFLCTGTLINQRYVLTAAGCLDRPGFQLTHVRLGEWKFSAPRSCVTNPYNEAECEYPAIDVAVAEKIAHPYYNNQSGNNDIAVLRLENEVKYTDFVRPICLPPSDYLPPPAGTLMVTSGWAITKTGAQSDVKLKGAVLMVGAEECNRTFPNYVQRKPNKACVESAPHRWCNGDSGSPLMRSYAKEDEADQQQWFQEGIIYQGLGCESKGSPGLYMRVSRYIHWILSHLKQ